MCGRSSARGSRRRSGRLRLWTGRRERLLRQVVAAGHGASSARHGVPGNVVLHPEPSRTTARARRAGPALSLGAPGPVEGS